MKRINQIIETSLYVKDIDAAERFYSRLLGKTSHSRLENRHVFFRIGDAMLLLFDAEGSRKSGSVPPHGADGQGHAAFAIQHNELDFWRNRLGELNIAIEQEYEWPTGGRSIYFRDPSGNSLELVTPDTWF